MPKNEPEIVTVPKANYIAVRRKKDRSREMENGYQASDKEIVNVHYIEVKKIL